MSFLARAFTRLPEVRDLTSSNFVPSPAEDAELFGVAGAGQAMRLIAFNACVTLLADTVASLTLTAYRQQGVSRAAVSPQPKLVTSPYPDLTTFEWVWMLMEALAVTGNGFAYVTARGPDDRPTGLMPIHPGVLTVQWPTDLVTGWVDPVYRILGRQVRNEDIVHIKRFPVAGAVLGMSPVEKAADSIGLGLAAERYGLRYFRDSANPSSVLESDLPLTDDQTTRLQKQWVSSHGGRRRPAILSGGVKWKPIAIAPNEAQFLETRQYQRSDIASLFRIPPHMIGDTQKSTSYGTGIEQQSIGFATFTLRPWLTCIEQAISGLLPAGQFVKFNIDGLLRGDVKTRWEAYQMGRNTGVYSVNDIRGLEDLTPVDDGDGRIQPINFGPLGYVPPVQPDSSVQQEPDNPPAASGEQEDQNVDD